MNKAETQGFTLAGFSAAVIGCGGLGCNIAVHLAGSGIGSLLLADFDTVSESNLNRQFLYGMRDIGRTKTEAAAERLRDYAPDTFIEAFNGRVSSVGDLDFARQCDIVFLAADNNAVRLVAQEFCTLHGIPLVNGGISGFYGSAYLYVPGKTPCLDCAGLTRRETENILSVSSTAGVIGALEAELGIRYLLSDSEESAGILHIYDNGEISKLKIKPQKNCGICGRQTNVGT